MGLVLHIIDLIAVFVAAFFFAWRFFESGNSIPGALRHAEVPLLIAFIGGYLLVRLIYRIVCACKRSAMLKEAKLDYVLIARKICRYYLGGLVPGLKREGTKADLDAVIGQYSAAAATTEENEKLTLCRGLLRFAVLVVVLAAGVVSLVFAINFEFPALVALVLLVLPFFCFPIALLLLVLTFMTCCGCGRRGLVRLRLWLRRWGLRLLLLGLDMLVVPSLEQVVSLIMFTKRAQCPAGEVYQYDIDGTWNGGWRTLVAAVGACVPCPPPWGAGNVTEFAVNCTDYFTAACGGVEKLAWLREDVSAGDLAVPNLLYTKDVLFVVGFVMLFGIGCIAVGVPLLYVKLIRDNARVLWVINVWGSNCDVKWLTLTNRLRTNGIGLFVDYKFVERHWSVFLILFKLLVMVIVTLTRYVHERIAFALPPLYLIWLCVTVWKRPYMYTFNNLLDCLLYLLTAAFNIFPILGAFDVHAPEIVMIVLTAAIAVIPVVALISIFCCRSDEDKYEEGDVTQVKPLDEEVVEERTTRLREKIEEHLWGLIDSGKSELTRKKATKAAEETDYDAKAAVNCFDEDECEAQSELKDLDKSEPPPVPEKRGGKEWKYWAEKFAAQVFDEDDTVQVDTGYLLTVGECAIDAPHEVATLNRLRLAATFQAMYARLDAFIDSNTMETVATYLNGCLLFGVFGLGWWGGQNVVAARQLGDLLSAAEDTGCFIR
jgi:hypothetical protein